MDVGVQIVDSWITLNKKSDHIKGEDRLWGPTFGLQARK
jgi:hypothetical protein